MYYWKGAASVEQIALEGVKEPKKCQFTVVVQEMVVTDAIQILPCTDESIECLEGVAEWKI